MFISEVCVLNCMVALHMNLYQEVALRFKKVGDPCSTAKQGSENRVLRETYTWCAKAQYAIIVARYKKIEGC